jgi:hypothetical protein
MSDMRKISARHLRRLREPVTTSGRKLRAHSAREVLGLLVHLAFAGPRALHRREGLDVWYGERRSDPGAPGRTRRCT